MTCFDKLVCKHNVIQNIFNTFTLKYAFHLFGTPEIGHYLKTTYKLIAEFSKMPNYSTADKLLSFST